MIEYANDAEHYTIDTLLLEQQRLIIELQKRQAQIQQVNVRLAQSNTILSLFSLGFAFTAILAVAMLLGVIFTPAVFMN